MCTNLIPAVQELIHGIPTGQPKFHLKHNYPGYKNLWLPCSKCIACLTQRSLTRAVQIYAELSVNQENAWFVTFTYDDDHLPENYSVDKTHLQLFWKRLRKKFPNLKIRYEQNSEYGTQTSRPHYHAAIFGLPITDLEIYSTSNYGITRNTQGINSLIGSTPQPETQANSQYNSEIITDLWGLGSVLIIPLTMASCLYIAQHTDKKIGGVIPNHELIVINPTTGEYIDEREPEAASRSCKPYIGAKWFEKYGMTDLYPDDFFLTPSGQKTRIPKAFDRELEKANPELYKQVKEQRETNAKHLTRAQQEYQAKFNAVKQQQKRKRSF